MATSEVTICNLALSGLGADPLHSMDENNKRARLCKTFFPVARDFILSKHDWTFARRYVQLQEIANYSDPLQDGFYAFTIPSDCLRPLDLDPPGLKDRWEVRGAAIITVLDSDVYLTYTSQVTDVERFSQEFINALYHDLMERLAMPITMDKKAVEMARAGAQMAFLDATSTNANIGSEHRNLALEPMYDTFVNPPE